MRVAQSADVWLELEMRWVVINFEILPQSFKEGVRVLMLIDRGVQNSNKGSRRWVNKIITTNPEEYDIAFYKLQALMNYDGNPNLRLYACVNPRKIDSAIRIFQHKQLDLNDDNRNLFYRRINDSFCSCLMQPESRASSLMLLDVDTHDTTEVNSFAVTNHNLKRIYSYPTPNGWHYIYEPFNVTLVDNMTTFEVKKDALILLDWIKVNDE